MKMLKKSKRKSKRISEGSSDLKSGSSRSDDGKANQQPLSSSVGKDLSRKEPEAKPQKNHELKKVVGTLSDGEQDSPLKNEKLSRNGLVKETKCDKPSGNQHQYDLSRSRKDTVFGKVIVGMDHFKTVDELGTSDGKPSGLAKIAECGELFEDIMRNALGSYKGDKKRSRKKAMSLDDDNSNRPVKKCLRSAITDKREKRKKYSSSESNSDYDSSSSSSEGRCRKKRSRKSNNKHQKRKQKDAKKKLKRLAKKSKRKARRSSESSSGSESRWSSKKSLHAMVARRSVSPFNAVRRPRYRRFSPPPLKKKPSRLSSTERNRGRGGSDRTPNDDTQEKRETGFISVEVLEVHAGVYLVKGPVYALCTGSTTGQKVHQDDQMLSVLDQNSSVIQYRMWNGFTSKLAAAILCKIRSIGMKPEARVLYLGGDGSQETVSRICDIVGSTGKVYAVQHSDPSELPEATGFELLDLEKKRRNLSAFVYYVRLPRGYADAVGLVDVIVWDVALSDQAQILSSNASQMLKPGGFLFFSWRRNPSMRLLVMSRMWLSFRHRY